MDPFVIICKVNVKCFCTVKWLACFVLGNVNISTDASLERCGRELHYLQQTGWLIPTPLYVKTAVLKHFINVNRS